MTEEDRTPALPGEQWHPSNGTEGECFIDGWCTNCARDKVMNGDATQEQADADPSLYCRILSDSFIEPQREWRVVDGVVKCIAFVPHGDSIPAGRCPNTMELPLTNTEARNAG